jgi:hypothetical protein
MLKYFDHIKMQNLQNKFKCYFYHIDKNNIKINSIREN